jgi:hypothetical protein
MDFSAILETLIILLFQSSSLMNVSLPRHTRNRSISFHYCIKGLYVAAFWTFQFAPTIEIEICHNMEISRRINRVGWIASLGKLYFLSLVRGGPTRSHIHNHLTDFSNVGYWTEGG